MAKDDSGWAWFEEASKRLTPEAAQPFTPGADQTLASACTRCFRGRDGETVLAYLRAITLGRALGPGAGDALLRHLEGQRQLVAHIIQLIQRGQGGN